MHFFDDLDEAVVLDVETTGVSPHTDRIVSASLCRLRFSAAQGEETLTILFNPQRPIPADATRVHGITDADVAGADTFAVRAQELRDFIGTRPIVAHNVAFDAAFLNAEFQRAGVGTLHRNRRYCTMLRYQAMNGGRWKGSNLDAVAFRFGIPVRQGHTHRADEDVRITVAIARRFHEYDTRREPRQRPVNSFWLPPAALNVLTKEGPMIEMGCGYSHYPPNLASALLMQFGAVLFVQIGYDKTYNTAKRRPMIPEESYPALIDTGAIESCIDADLARALHLPILCQINASGMEGKAKLNVHLGQIYVPELEWTIFGQFIGVHLRAGQQPHFALIGRTFLQQVTLTYEGRTGQVALSTEQGGLALTNSIKDVPLEKPDS